MVFGDRRRRLCSPPSLSRSLPRRRRRRSPSPAARRFPAAARAAAAAADDQPEVDRAREGGRKEVPLLPHPSPLPHRTSEWHKGGSHKEYLAGFTHLRKLAFTITT